MEQLNELFNNTDQVSGITVRVRNKPDDNFFMVMT